MFPCTFNCKPVQFLSINNSELFTNKKQICLQMKCLNIRGNYYNFLIKFHVYCIQNKYAYTKKITN